MMRWFSNTRTPVAAPTHHSRLVRAPPPHTHTHTLPTHRFQRIIELPGYPRGCHIITRKIQEAMPELGQMEVGMANLFSE
jgi:hypothetical protein